jgi:hypothetical protein
MRRITLLRRIAAIAHFLFVAASAIRAAASTDGLRDLVNGPTVGLGLQIGW